MALSKRLIRYASKRWGITTGDAATIRTRIATEMAKGNLSREKLKELQGDDAPPVKKDDPNNPGKKGVTDPPAPKNRTDHDDGEDYAYKSARPFFRKLADLNVKGIEEKFSKSRRDCVYPAMLGKSGIPHPMAGRPVMLGGKQLYHPSEFDLAVCGSFWKMATNALMRQINLNPPEWADPRESSRKSLQEQLINYAIYKGEWTGSVGGDFDSGKGMSVHRDGLTEAMVKTLIADTTSGGLYAVPQAFDDAIVMYPILYGELMPYVTIKDVRSNRVQGALMNRPKFTSGVVEGTTVTPFDTANFIQAFDTGIYNCQGAMEIGKDLEDDSPAAIGQTIVEMFGQEALAWGDRVIAYGNGVTEPLGALRTVGATAVNSAAGAGGPMTVSDFMGLQFGINKALRTEPGFRTFLSNDTGYKNSRLIQVTPNDQRLVFGMDVQSYSLLGDNYAVQNDIPEGIFGYFNATRYRLYRRQGTQITMDDTGYALRTRNTRLILARMRFGGRLDYAGAIALMTDGQMQ